MAPETHVSKLAFQPGLTFCFEYKGFFSDFSARLLGLKVIAPKTDRETYYRIETSPFLSFNTKPSILNVKSELQFWSLTLCAKICSVASSKEPRMEERS